MSVIVQQKATAKRLTTVPAIKAELEIADAADDAYLAALADQASDAIAGWCNRAFAVETVTEYQTLRFPRPAILLARWPLIDVTGATRSGEALEIAGTEVDDIEGGVYRLDAEGGRIDWPSGDLVVTYSAGYVLPGQPGRNLPFDIERAALTLIKANWHARSRDPRVRSETIDGAGATDYFAGTSSQLPPEVESLLTPYRNLIFG